MIYVNQRVIHAGSAAQVAVGVDSLRALRPRQAALVAHFIVEIAPRSVVVARDALQAIQLVVAEDRRAAGQVRARAILQRLRDGVPIHIVRKAQGRVSRARSRRRRTCSTGSLPIDKPILS